MTKMFINFKLFQVAYNIAYCLTDLKYSKRVAVFSYSQKPGNAWKVGRVSLLVGLQEEHHQNLHLIEVVINIKMLV